MVDDRPEDTGSLPGFGRGRSARRRPSTSRPRRCPTRPRVLPRARRGTSEPSAAPRPRTPARQWTSHPPMLFLRLLRAGLALDRRAGLRRGRGCAGDWCRLDAGLARVQPASAPSGPTAHCRAIDGLTARVAGLEAKSRQGRAPDPAAAARTEAAGKIARRAAQRARSATRAQGEKLAAARQRRANQRRADAAASPDLSAINERIARSSARCGRRAPRSRSRAASSPIARADAKPADDMPLRRVVAASLLDVLGSDGDPYPAALAAAKALAPNPDALKPLDEFRRQRACRTPQAEPRTADAGAETVAGRAAEQCHHRRGHRRSAAGGRRQTGPIERTDAVGNDRGAVVGAGHRGGAAQRFQRGAARVEDAGAGRSRRRRKPGSTRPTRAMPRLPPPVNSRPTPWRRSPNRRNRISMYPDHSVSGVDRAGGGGRGVGCRSDRRRRAVVGRLARADHAAGIRAGARHHHCRGDDGVGILRALWRTPERIRRSRRERRHARGRHAITQGLLAIGHGDSTAARAACRSRAPPCRARSAGAAAARAVGAARRRPRRRAARLPRHGRARGYAAVGPARIVHRGAARRRSRRRGHDRGRSAETRAVLDLGLACGARIPLRQGRLERRADDPRQQSVGRA